MNLFPVVDLIRCLKPRAATFGLAFAMCLGCLPSAHAQKVAVVDVAKIFKDYYKTRELETKLDETRRTAKKEFDEKLEHHHRLLEEIARIQKDIDAPAATEAVKAERSKQRDDKSAEAKSLETAIHEFRDSREHIIQEQTLRVRTQIVEDIMVIVNQRVENDHYDLVLNKSARGLEGKQFTLYANASFDLSDDIITALNKNRPAGTPLPQAPTDAPAVGGGEL